MTVGIIFNPAAARGRAARQRPVLECLLRRRGISYRLWDTTPQGTGFDLARQAAERCEMVLAAGGDGTVHEVSRGLIAAESSVPFGVLPLGSGNDFACMLGMPTRLDRALAALLRAKPTRIDYGSIEVGTPDGHRSSSFVNGIGVGFDAEVAARAVQHKTLPGMLGYLVEALRVVRTWEAPVVDIVQEPGRPTEHRFRGRLLLLALGNGRSAGGGVRLTPDACLDDGWFDTCLVEAMPVSRILQLIPRALRGTHGTAPEVLMQRARVLDIRSAQPVPVHTDGEILTRAATHVRVRLVPRALPVLIPHPVDPLRFADS